MRGKMMTNLLALLLVSASLATAGLFTRNPDVAVKQGHRAVVVEFEKDDGNTKVSISTQEDGSQAGHDQKGYAGNANENLSGKMEETKEKIKKASTNANQKLSGKMEEAKEKIKESSTNANEKLSGKMEEAKEKIKEASASVSHETEKEETPHPHGFNPRELVCDAYGKCKHKIADAMEKTVEKTKEIMAGTAHAAAEEAKEVVSEAIGKVKDTVAHTTHKASDKAQQMRESAKDAKDKVVSKGSEVKEEAERKIGSKKGSLKGIFRRVGVCLLSPVGGVVHLLGFAAAYGTGLWVTFASNYVVAGALPRQQFAMVQSKIYPVYFKAMASGIGLALMGHLMGLKEISPPSMGVLQGFNLMAAMGMVLVNMMYFEPRATKVMLERMKKEKEEATVTVDSVAGKEKKEAGKSGVLQSLKKEAAKSGALQSLNSDSSLLNVATLMSLTWHLVSLGSHVQYK